MSLALHKQSLDRLWSVVVVQVGGGKDSKCHKSLLSAPGGHYKECRFMPLATLTSLSRRGIFFHLLHTFSVWCLSIGCLICNSVQTSSSGFGLWKCCMSKNKNECKRIWHNKLYFKIACFNHQKCQDTKTRFE